jgi:hypothetical protein
MDISLGGFPGTSALRGIRIAAGTWCAEHLRRRSDLPAAPPSTRLQVIDASD